jgi:hypothetical protein
MPAKHPLKRGKSGAKDSEMSGKERAKLHITAKLYEARDSSAGLLSWKVVNGGCFFRKVCYNTYGQMNLTRGQTGRIV